MGGKGIKIWYSYCACGAQLSQTGSGRAKRVCDICKAKRNVQKTYEQRQRRLERMRLYSKMRYARKVRTQNKRKSHLSDLRQLVINEKLRRGKCEWSEGCPLPEVTVNNYHAYDFDHRDPSKKKFMMSKIRLQSEQSVIEEMEKCDLLCAYHHRIRTQRDRHQVLAKNAETKPQLVLFDN
jgi:hypothetical protein